jgi:cytochrome P450/NADPH-cytochrome P450 reductase
MKEYGCEGDAKPVTGGPGIAVDLLSPRAKILHHEVYEAVVVDNKTLTAPGEPVKMHIEIQLPNNMTYRPGDYLVVLPINPRETVARVMRLFRIPWDAHIKITAGQRTSFPSGDSVALTDVLEAYVELTQPASKKNILALVEATEDQKLKEELRKLSSDLYVSEIVTKHMAVIDLLERYPAVNLSLAAFLDLLPPMRLRR